MTQVEVKANVSQSRWNGRSSSRLQIWYDSLTVYQFFIDVTGAGNVPSYAKSTDAGATWGAAVTLTNRGSVGALAIDVYYERWNDTTNNPIAHVTWLADDGTRGLFYQWVDLSTETQQSAAAQLLAGFSPTPYGGLAAIGVALNGDIHVVGVGPTTGFVPRHFISTNGGTSFSAAATFGIEQQNNIQILPDASTGDSADVLAIWSRYSDHTLYAVPWDNSASSWLTPAVINNSTWPAYEAVLPAETYANLATGYRRSDGHLFVLAYNGNNTGTPNTLRCFEIYGSGSITQRTDVLTGSPYADSCGLTIAPSTGDLWVAYARDNGGASFTSMEVYYKTSSDDGVTWSTETLYSSESARMNMVYFDPSPAVDLFLPAYFEGSGSPHPLDIFVEVPAISTATQRTVPVAINVAVAGQRTVPVAINITVPTVQFPIVLLCLHGPLDGAKYVKGWVADSW